MFLNVTYQFQQSFKVADKSELTLTNYYNKGLHVFICHLSVELRCPSFTVNDRGQTLMNPHKFFKKSE